MAETYGTRDLSWYAKQAPNKLFEEEEAMDFCDSCDKEFEEDTLTEFDGLLFCAECLAKEKEESYE